MNNNQSKVKGRKKGIKIGSAFLLTKEADHFKISSVSGNFSLRVGNSLPFYAACDEATNNPSFRPAFHDMVTMLYFPCAISFNQDIFDKFTAFQGSIVDVLKGTESTDAKHEEDLEHVKEMYNEEKANDELPPLEDVTSVVSLAKALKEDQLTGHAGSLYISIDRPMSVVEIKSLEDVKAYHRNNNLSFVCIDITCVKSLDEDIDAYVVSGMINGVRTILGLSSKELT